MLTIRSILFLSLLCAGLLTTGAWSDYEYRFLECETYAAETGAGLRNEGFTSWMGHPSAGKVMVLGGPGHWLDYEVKDLWDAEYHVYVRGLAWASGCAVDLYWNGDRVGQTRYTGPGTVLKWSDRVGTVRGPGSHTLRIVGAEGITQAPYLDVVLLTTQAGYKPPDDDQDFASYVADLPVLRLGETSVAPRPSGASGDTTITVTDASAPSWLMGTNTLKVTALAQAGPRPVRAEAWFEDEPPTSRELALGADAQTVELPVVMPRSGAGTLHLRLCEGARVLLSGSYPVSAPDPFSAGLDEYAYPDTATQALWIAKAALDPALLPSVRVSVSVRRADQEQPLAEHSVVPAQEMSQTLDIAGLPRGRYEVRAQFLLNGRVVSEKLHRFRVHEPFALEPWEPAVRTSVTTDRVLLNGRPFLGRLLFHAAANESTRGHGFNMVQCWGGDPNPVESIGKHLDACAEAGMYGSVALFNNQYLLPGREFNLEHLREVVLRYKDHPALLMWDLVDEPDGCDITPAAVETAARLVRELDPNHIVWVNLCRPTMATDYLASQDLWSFDTYPIPSQGLQGYLNWLDITDRLLRGRKPLGTCLQTYQYSRDRLRMPTPDELRASAYLHMIHGYTWFGYYSYYDGEPAVCLARDPELYSHTRALNGELVAFAPVLLSEGDFASVDTGLEATVCQAAMKQHEGQTYLVVVSLSTEPLTVRLPARGGSATLLFEEERTLPIREGVLADSLRPSAARVYRINDGD